MALTQLPADILCILKQNARIHPIEIHPINVPNVWGEIARALELQQCISRLAGSVQLFYRLTGPCCERHDPGRFVVMEYLHGSGITAGSANERQIFCLGRDTARMHQAW